MLDATACRPAPEVATVLGQDDLLAWFQSLSIPEPTCSLIDHIRSSGPSRRVGGGRSNVSGRYPSRKMGVTIQFESHRVELAGIYEMEHDATVLEYFDQPPAIKLDYESVAGKRMGVLHTPDFFVIRRGEAGWEEWKTEEELRRLNMRNPNRYAAGSDEPWRCPPGQAYAERLGSIIVFALRRRSTGCFSGTFSFSTTICDAENRLLSRRFERLCATVLWLSLEHPSPSCSPRPGVWRVGMWCTP